MSTLQKIIVCGLAALFILILMCGWGYFAYHGKTDVGVFIAQIGTLITIAVGLITAFAGHQAARPGQGQSGSPLIASGSVAMGNLAAPLSANVQPVVTVNVPEGVVAADVAKSVASAMTATQQ
jgi:hypothetical protein